MNNLRKIFLVYSFYLDGADYYIINAGEFYCPVNDHLEGHPINKTCTAVNISDKKITILGFHK